MSTFIFGIDCVVFDDTIMTNIFSETMGSSFSFFYFPSTYIGEFGLSLLKSLSVAGLNQ
jgi:hypothetical protein